MICEKYKHEHGKCEYYPNHYHCNIGLCGCTKSENNIK